MSTDIAVRQTTQLSTEQLRYLAGTDFVQPGMRNNIPAILACVATGRELGIGDMVALRSIHIIDGKATFSAELMVQLVRRAGHSITGEVAEGSAKVSGRRADNGDEMSVVWTLAMAERAGLANKANWKRYPESMLWARAVSQLCRMLFADCFAGATYTTEELGAEQTDEYGALTEPEEDSSPIQRGESANQNEAHSATNALISGSVSEPEDDHLFPPADRPTAGLPLASEKQQKLIIVKANEAGLDDDARHELIEGLTGQPSTKGVPAAMVNTVLAEIERRGEAKP